MTSGTLNRLLQPTVFKGLLIFVIFFVTLMMGCDKEEPCSGDEPFVEPAWVKEIQTELEKESYVCSADMRIFRWNNQYYIVQRILADTTWNVIHTFFDYNGNIVNDPIIISTIDSLDTKLESINRIWYYSNPTCTWNSGINLNCRPLETDSVKILEGRWERTATILNGASFELFRLKSSVGIQENMAVSFSKTKDENILSEYHFNSPIVLEFKLNGEMIMEHYSGYHNTLQKNEGYYSLDSLLHFEFIKVEYSYPRKWKFEFSYCNNSLKIAYKGLPFPQEDIYIRQE